MIIGIFGYGVILGLYLLSDFIFNKMQVLTGEKGGKKRRRLTTPFVVAGTLGLLVAGHWVAGIILAITVIILQILDRWFDKNFLEEE